MRDTLRHRGPDDAGAWWSPDARVGLGHRRLAIIDLTPGGHQPMLDSAGQVALVFNGEIYNYRDLRHQLEGRGVRFRSTSDTEVLLEAYRAWGTDCLERLHGMFAFAIWDEAKRWLFLARDRAGEKPLFYHCDESEGTLTFASELKALMADPAFPRVLNPAALNHYLTYGYVPDDLCMLQGVRKLPQGSALLYDLSRRSLRVWRYWRLPAGPAPRSADADELAERLHELLRNSVRRQLVADVPVGILLSGGIDSSLVTAMAAEVASGPVKTFTITFPGHAAYDEGPYARQVAEHFGTEHTELPAAPAVVELLPELARQYDEPMADSSMVPTYIVSRLIRRHATVALGGDGGDELFGGYPTHQWLVQLHGLRRLAPRWLGRALYPTVQRALRLGRVGRNFALGLLRDDEGGLLQLNTHFDEPFRRRLLGPDLVRRLRPDFAQPENFKRTIQADYATLVQKATAMDFRTYLVDDILVKVDRASMLTSLEVRAPFLDPAVIEFAFSQVPDALRVTSREKKILPRRLAQRLLPKGMDLKRKQGFTLPLAAWFRGAWGRYVREVLLSSDAGWFRRETLEQLLAEQKQGFSHTQRLFTLTMLELWRRQYDVHLAGG